MKIGDNIKRIRTAKDLSQKEVVTTAKLDTAQYSRIENGKTDPSVGTLERIAKALGVSLAELFASTDELKEINSHDKTLMEKVSLIEALTDEERKTIYTMLDAFIGKKKLKDALANVLSDVKWAQADACARLRIKLIHELEPEEKSMVFKMIDAFLTKKKFKDFFQKNVAAL